MTEEAKRTLKEINKVYFDDHIDEIIRNDEKNTLTIKMKTKEIYSFQGDVAKSIYKQLVTGNMK
jgi:hypothetical protein